MCELTWSGHLGLGASRGLHVLFPGTLQTKMVSSTAILGSIGPIAKTAFMRVRVPHPVLHQCRHRPPACSKKMRPSNRPSNWLCSALTITVCSFSVSNASALRQLSISWIRRVGLSTRKRASPTTAFNIPPEFTLKS